MSTLNNANYSMLSNIFNRSFIDKLFNGNYVEYINLAIKEVNIQPNTNTTIVDLFEIAFNQLLKNYRCEYIYKNAIVSKILLGKHSLNTSVMFNEMIVGQSKADLVMLNGTSTVYEIKTELDSLDRLSGQIDSYMSIFDYIYVVSYEKNIERISKIVPEHVGIMILSNKYTLRTIKKAKSNKDNTLSDNIFDILRKEEYLNIIKQKFGSVPEVPNTLIYRTCKEMFSKLTPREAHDVMVETLKKRRIKESQKNLVSNVPHCLKLFTLYEEFDDDKCTRFRKILNSQY